MLHNAMKRHGTILVHTKSKILHWLILFVFIGLFLFSRTTAQERHTSPLLQYIHKIYTSEDGLPQNRARALVQTSDGFLWIGTQDGLARFNGTMFQVYSKENTPSFKHNDITSLFQTEDSSLWIGTFNGVAQLKKGVFTSHPINTGPVRGFAADRAGNLWIGTMNKGIYKFRDGKFDSIATIQGADNNSLNVLSVDYDGNLWVGISGRGLSVFKNGKWSFFNSKNGFPSNTVRSFYVGFDHTVWIGTENGLVRWKYDSFHTYTTKDGLSNNIITSLYEDKSHTLWIGTERGGICQFKDNSFTSYSSRDGLSSDYVTSISEDREGSLWVGTFNAGLNQFWKGKFINYTMRDGVPSTAIRAMLTAHDGAVWVGAEGGGILRFDGKKFAPFKKYELPSDYIRSLFEDSHGNLWIGLREGLAQYRNGAFRVFTTKDGLSQNFVRVIGEDHDGRIWAGTYNNGMNRFENGRFVNYQNKGMPIKIIRSLLVDHTGVMWIGSSEGLLRWQNGSATMYTSSDGLPSDPIFDMIEDREHTIWMGSYGGGLVRLKNGKFTCYTFAQGLFNDIVMKILEDDSGNLWLSSLKGISCVSKQMLDDFASGKINRIHTTSYSSSDGMIVSECSGPSGCKTSNGFLWFPTPKGIVVIDPKIMTKNILPPPVVIERVVVDRIDYSPYNYRNFSPGSGQVEFYYGGLSFIAPQKLNFRYMLEGFENEWRIVGTRRSAFYTNLSPGKYIFRVTACNSDGVWNEIDAGFAFELKPHFYQTFWFFAFVFILIGGAGFGLHRLRVWRLIAKEEMLKVYMSEAMTKIKVLNGLIPICFNCKKVRDDQGYWKGLERYIKEHSEATFSHGVCPECAEKLRESFLSKNNEKLGDILSQILPTDSPKK
jgi:ligand-binding sensor domain-containing protein